MAIEKSATTRSTPSANRPSAAPSGDKAGAADRTPSVASPAADAGRERDDAGAKSAVLEPSDRVTLSNPSDQEDFNPNAMSDLSRSLKAEAAGREPSADEADSAPETDSILDPRSEDFEERMAAHAEQSSAQAKERLETGEYASEAARQSDLLESERSVEDYIEAREYIDSVAPGPLESYVPDDFVGTQKERTQAALRARREEGIELMDEVMADPDLTIEERNAAMGSVMRHFEYNATRARQRDPVTLENVHQGAFPEEIYGSDNPVDARTTSIINHDPNKGLSPYSITFDPTNKAINPETHISSFVRNPMRLGDVAWSEFKVGDAIGRAWESFLR